MKKLSMSLEEIYESANIAIYGTGKRGQFFYEYITACRPDITVKCFLDSFKERNDLSPPILKPSCDLITGLNIDIILICSYNYSEMFCYLHSLGFHSYSPIKIFTAEWFEDSMTEEEIIKFENIFRGMLKTLPKGSFVSEILGQIEVQKNNHDAALVQYKKLLEFFPDDYRALVSFAQFMTNTNRFAEAEQLYESIIGRFPHRIYGYLGLAKVLSLKKLVTEAIALYQLTISKFPDHPKAYIGLSSSFRRSCKVEAAQKLLSSVKNKFEFHIDYLIELKLTYICLGEFKKAKKIIPKISDLTNTDKNRFRIPILFNHIPKCGGTTITQYLHQNYNPCLKIDVEQIGNCIEELIKYYRMLTDKEKLKYLLICGHGSEKLLPYTLPESKKILVLRHPVERVLSQYFFDASRGLVHELHNFASKTNNIYIKMFSASQEYRHLEISQLVQQCYQNIHEQYDLVGITEDINGFLAELQLIANLPIPYAGRRDNITGNRKSRNVIDPKLIQHVTQELKLDIELYNKIKRDWELGKQN